MSTFKEKWQEIKRDKKKFLVFILLCLLLTCGTGLLVFQGLSGNSTNTAERKPDEKIPTLNTSDTLTNQNSKITAYNDDLKEKEDNLNNLSTQNTDFEKMLNGGSGSKTGNSISSNYDHFGEKENDYLVKNTDEENSTTISTTVTENVPKNSRSRTAKSSNAIIYSQNQMSAVVHNWNREIRSGSNVRLRTTEEFKANGIIIPRNTNVYATATAQGERMKMLITGANLNGEVVPLNLEVFDNDGVSGLHIPTHLQREIVNDAVTKGSDGTKTTVKLGTFGEVTSNVGSKVQNNPNIIVNDGYKIFLKPKN